VRAPFLVPKVQSRFRSQKLNSITANVSFVLICCVCSEGFSFSIFILFLCPSFLPCPLAAVPGRGRQRWRRRRRFPWPGCRGCGIFLSRSLCFVIASHRVIQVRGFRGRGVGAGQTFVAIPACFACRGGGGLSRSGSQVFLPMSSNLGEGIPRDDRLTGRVCGSAPSASSGARWRRRGGGCPRQPRVRGGRSPGFPEPDPRAGSLWRLGNYPKEWLMP